MHGKEEEKKRKQQQQQPTLGRLNNQGGATLAAWNQPKFSRQ